MGNFGQIILFIIIALVTNHTVLSGSNKITDNDLKLVFVVFRHGDRTNVVQCNWPKNPYRNETYKPYGLGQLTNKGKEREFKLGKLVRSRYNKFLEDSYELGVIEPMSTNSNRTKASLLLFLAGLYPPAHTSMEWEKTLNWQPIPYNYVDKSDHVLTHPLYNCPKYTELFSVFLKSKENRQLEGKYSEHFGYINSHTGLNVTQLMDISTIFCGLFSQRDWGFPLPDWASKIYPILENTTVDQYLQATGTTRLTQLTGGFLLKQIINYTHLKFEDNLRPKNRKMFIYSGHEYNVAYLLRAMNVFKPHIPPYGACILIEVYTINEVNGVKIFYENYTTAEPQPLKIPGCDYFCPFDKFVGLLQQNLPPHDHICDKD